MSIDDFREKRRFERFRNTLRLDAVDLEREARHGGGSVRVALKRHHGVVGWIQVKYLDDDHLKLCWSVADGTTTDSQKLTVHWGSVLSLRCPECEQFRRRLFFTSHDNCPFDTNWFHCDRCINARVENRKHSRRAKAKGRNSSDRRAKRALHGAVASEPVAPLNRMSENVHSSPKLTGE